MTPLETPGRLGSVELNLSPEKEARLRDLAVRSGKDTQEVLEEALDRLLEYDAKFAEAVEKGRAEIRRGEFIGHDEVLAQIERRLRK